MNPKTHAVTPTIPRIWWSRSLGNPEKSDARAKASQMTTTIAATKTTAATKVSSNLIDVIPRRSPDHAGPSIVEGVDLAPARLGLGPVGLPVGLEEPDPDR